MTSVTVITPTIAGREKFFDRCQRSVKAQTVPVKHLVIDGTGLGSTVAFKTALDMVTSEFVMPLSDDDWIAPHAVETLLGLIDGFDVVFGQMLIVNPRGARVMEMGGAVLWRKSLTDQLGGFDTRWQVAADTDLYSRFAHSGARMRFHPEPLYFFTEHETHDSFVRADLLAQELDEIKRLYPDAERIVREVVVEGLR